MEMRSLGASGMQVSRLCFGTLTMGPMQRGFSPQRGAALLMYAYERGFRFLDTADIYDTYPHIRLALKNCGYRVSDGADSAEQIIELVYQALKAKGHDPIYQIVGYIISGDPTYITSYNNARSLIKRLERDELLEELVRFYVENHDC